MAASVDRRVLLARFADPEPVEELQADDSTEALLWKLLYPRVIDTYLPVARPWPQDAEKLVHDTRVSSRRLVEALELAHPLLDGHGRRRAQAQAKTLRRALGAGREAHVMQTNLERLVDAAGLTPETITGPQFGSASTDTLDEVKEAFPPEKLIARAVDVLGLATTPKKQLGLRAIGGPHLARRSSGVIPLIDAVRDPKRIEDQHRLRIRFKRLRYTTEILAKPFADVIDEKATVRLLKALQDALGELNDMKDALDWLKSKRGRQALDAQGTSALLEVGHAELERVQAEATALVLEHAPKIAGDLYRAAGVIGPLA